MAANTDLTNPHALMSAFSDRFNAHDLDGLVALYEPEAAFAPRPGVTVTGHDAIRAALAEFLALRPTISAVVAEVLSGGDVALVLNDWDLTGTAADGTELRQQGRSSDVVRRQPDGRWLVVVDKP